MPTLLPPSEPAAPVQGQPGHFAWSNWIMQAVKNLDAGTSHGNDLNGRNKIINGDFSVNQRTLVNATVFGYGFDRWYFGPTGGTCSHTPQSAALGDLPESAPTFARIVTSGQAATTDFCYLTQKIESVRTLSGKTATVSFWAKTTSGTPKVAIEMQQSFGTGGSPSTSVLTYAGQITLSTAWTRYSVTVAIPSIAGKQLGTTPDNHLALALWVSAGSSLNSRTGSLGIQSGTFDFWGVQVEEGSIATAYEQKTYADELRACQRYFQRWQQPPLRGFCATTSTANRVAMTLPVSMRVMPTYAQSAGAGLPLYDGVIATEGTIVSAFCTTTKVEFDMTTLFGSMVVGRPLGVYQTGSAYLDLNAEF